ncbi:MAG: DUF2437 domain-containing protein [Dehalococcoidia bacterium]|nr:DUF2437 domain-containing protein [Dehalococcoidia bacterium]
MKLARFETGGRTLCGVVDGDSIKVVTDTDLRDVIMNNGAVAETGETVALGDARLLAPLKPAKNVFCVGLNYQDHITEGERAIGRKLDPQEVPIFFTKPPTSVIGPEDDVLVHQAVTTEVDWEAELAVVIGRGARNISYDDALDHVFGYTLVNDISHRDIQMKHRQWFRGKGLDGACPIGPWIVTADEIPDPQALDVLCRVNGETKQSASTAQMIFDVRTLIESLSAGLTLEPGDILATGTPNGVGFARTPPEFLKAGDVVEVEVSGVGILRNPVVNAD